METIFSSIAVLASLFALIFLFVIVQDLWRQRGRGDARTGPAFDGNAKSAENHISQLNRVRGYDSPELYRGDTLLARAAVPRGKMPMPGHQPITTLYELIVSGSIPADVLARLLMDLGMVTEAKIMKELNAQRPRRDLSRDSKDATPKPGRKND